MAEKLITLAKQNTLVARRRAIAVLNDRRLVDEKGLTLVPLRFYLKRGIVKCELGIAKGKKLFDKRDDIRKRDQRRELERDFRVK